MSEKENLNDIKQVVLTLQLIRVKISCRVPVVTLLKVIASAALPPRAIHIRSNSCSLVKRYWSRGKIWANPRAAFVRGAMET